VHDHGVVTLEPPPAPTAPVAPAAALVRAEGLSVAYGDRVALADVSFALHAGERIAVLGPNGGGSDLAGDRAKQRCLAAAGRIGAPDRCAVVPQTERSRLDFPVSALDVAVMGALSRLYWWQRPRRADRTLAQRALERVGLGELARETFGELSGGQRQRVLVARALVQDARVLLLDEPFSGLDVPGAELLMGLLDELAAEGRGLLIATHDVDQARCWDRVLCLNAMQVAFGPPARALTRATLERTYGGAIVEVPAGAGDDPCRAILPAHHHNDG